MKLFILVCVLTFAQGATTPDLVSSDRPFTPDGKVRIETDPNCSKCASHKIEVGSLNGVAYQFYYSGSAKFAGMAGNTLDFAESWDSNQRIKCQKDAITDDKFCYMYIKDLWVTIHPDLRPLVRIGTEHYPRSIVVMRLDKQEPISNKIGGLSGSFSFEDSQQILERMSKAKTVTTRYSKWPDGLNRDNTWDVYGFNEAYAFLRWAVVRIKQLTFLDRRDLKLVKNRKPGRPRKPKKGER